MWIYSGDIRYREAFVSSRIVKNSFKMGTRQYATNVPPFIVMVDNLNSPTIDKSIVCIFKSDILG